MSVKKDSLLKEIYNKANNIVSSENLNIVDDIDFSYLDILKEKTLRVEALQMVPCICKEPTNLHLYYEACDKCEGKGYIKLSGNEVICNKCHANKVINKRKCNICLNKGYYLDKEEVEVKLNNNLKNGDKLVIKGKGILSEGKIGDLIINVKINDFDHYMIDDVDVYQKKVILFSKEDVLKNASKKIETIQGYKSITSKDKEKEYETIKIENAGFKKEDKIGDYYVVIKKELTPIKGDNIFKNIIVKEDADIIYLKREDINSNLLLLPVYYFKIGDSDDYISIKNEDIDSYKVIKIQKEGKDGYHGGEKGDLFLKIFKGDFYYVNEELYDLNIKISKKEILNGKKVIEINEEKTALIIKKDVDKVSYIKVNDLGLITSENKFLPINFRVNPFDFEVYAISLKLKKKDKKIYVQDYKKYFFEEVNYFTSFINLNDYLEINVSLLKKMKNKNVKDKDGNIVVIKILKDNEVTNNG